MIFHHLTLAVFVLPPELRWSQDVFEKLVQSLGDQAKAFNGDWTIVFQGTEDQRQFCQLRLQDPTHDPQVRFTIVRFKTTVLLKMEAKYGATEEQVELVVASCKRLGYRVIKRDDIRNRGIVSA
jgi:hypothetical protein